MKPEFQELEERLSAMRPARPDAAVLARFEAAMDDSLAMPSVEDARFEALVRGVRPVTMPAELMASLERVVASTPFPINDNIVLFTKAPAGKGFQRRYRSMAAAAVVACLGATAALFMPAGRSGAPVASSTAPAEAAPSVPASGYVPASFGRNVHDASDEGIVWKDGKPHRVVKIVYKELGSFINAEGKKVEVAQPRVEYILVPEKID